MNLKDLEKFIDQRDVDFLSSIDESGYPNLKAMLKPKRRVGLKEFYFSTNTSSLRVTQYLKNEKAAIYFYRKGLLHYRGLMLLGKMEVLCDQESKEMMWNARDIMYYPKGVTDPDYCILKFTAISGRYYQDLKTIPVEVEV